MIPLLQFLALAAHPCVGGMIEAGDVARVSLCLEVARQEQAIGVPAWLAGRMGRTAAWIADELADDGRMTSDEIAAVLAIGRGESALDAGGRSHSALPDEQQGGSHGALQMTARTAAWLGVDMGQLRPRRPGVLGDHAKAARYAARAALTFYETRTGLARRVGVPTHLEALRRIARSDQHLRDELWASWAAGCGVRVRQAGPGLRRTLEKRNKQFPRYQLAVHRWMGDVGPAHEEPLTTAALLQPSEVSAE
ncbi:MAG: hypothetical protein R3F60_15745 [bacterium]